jgi:hypothetical protein
VAAIGIQTADALEAAHRIGVLHRDVKPGNLLVGHYGGIKLADFGIAAVTSANTSVTDALAGTLSFMAPEILQGAKATPKSDVYSLGSTLYTLLTGQVAFASATDESPFAALMRVVNDPLPDLRESGTPDELARVVEGAMTKDPADRLHSAEAVVVALQAVSASLGWPEEPTYADRPPQDTTAGARMAAAADERSPVGPSGTEQPTVAPLGVNIDKATILRPSAGLGSVAPPTLAAQGPVASPRVPAADHPPVLSPTVIGSPATSSNQSAFDVTPPASPDRSDSSAESAGGEASGKRRSRTLRIGAAVVVVGALAAGAIVLVGHSPKSGGRSPKGSKPQPLGFSTVDLQVQLMPVVSNGNSVAVTDQGAWVVGGTPNGSGLQRVSRSSMKANAAADLPFDGYVDTAISGSDNSLWAAGSVAAGDGHRAQVVKLDHRSGEVEQTVDLPFGTDNPMSLSADLTGVWVAGNVNDEDGNTGPPTLVRVESGASKLAATIEIPGDIVFDVAARGDDVWLAVASLDPKGRGAGSVLRVDAKTHKVGKPVDLQANYALSLAADDTYLWVVTGTTTMSGDEERFGSTGVVRVDKATGAGLTKVDLACSCNPVDVAAGPFQTWVAGATIGEDGVPSGSGHIIQLDSSGVREVASAELAGPDVPNSLETDYWKPGTVWAATVPGGGTSSVEAQMVRVSTAGD